MAYCRWSSENFKCDIYAYESDAGYMIHVAGMRFVGDLPEMPNIMTTPRDEYIAAYRRHMDAITATSREPIDLPHAGESFCLADLEELESKLRSLREIGYHIPDYAFDEIAEERAAEAS